MTMWPAEPCAPQNPNPRRLAGPELFAWLALRRADAGRVARIQGRYYDSGRRMPCFLLGVFEELVEAGLLTLAEPDPSWPELRRATLTRDGRARFAALSERENQGRTA